MDLQSLGIILACFLSLYLGIFVAILAEEELKDGLKYLRAFENVLLSLILFVFLYKYIKLYAIIFSVLIWLIFFAIKSIKRDLYIYPGLGILLGINNSLLMISLIFLYGFPAGSIVYEKFKKKSYIQVLYFIPFIFAAIVVSYL